MPYGSDVDEDEDSSSDEYDEDDDEYSDYGDDSDEYMSDMEGSLETLVDDEPIRYSAKSMKMMRDDVPMMDVDTDMIEEPRRGRSRTRISPTSASFSPVRRHRS